MDWASILTFATVGVGLAVDFSSSDGDAEDYADNSAELDDFMTPELAVDTDPLIDTGGYGYAVAEFSPDVDPDTAVLPWGDDEIDALYDDAQFTLTAA
ncbi:hypothetical protein BVC71_06630 [Marivivens niveibacter]|uniref:Uncharacterized protein n=1 Tax=Marivivens niveibacter TaxID=1930667 RepID=A0A251WYG4_9RHOB|nr:hypothetical protein [Marivivens niveibacter]OUD09520.1 hypothetical protein BVC71_06630 [Marivivens niveibacter]